MSDIWGVPVCRTEKIVKYVPGSPLPSPQFFITLKKNFVIRLSLMIVLVIIVCYYYTITVTTINIFREFLVRRGGGKTYVFDRECHQVMFDV